MPTIDKITALQAQGMSDAEIIKRLRDEGVSPKEINSSLAQAKVKTAVSQPEEQYIQNPEEFQQEPGMQESIMPQQESSSQFQQQEQYIQNPEEFQQQQEQHYPETQQPQTYPAEQGYYYPQQITDTNTMSEIAEQVVLEKFSEFNKKTGDLVSFKNDIQERVSDLNERLKRIEKSIDKLQQSVIGKIGEFGENTSEIHKDLTNLHETMSKLMNPLIDNYRELQKLKKK